MKKIIIGFILVSALLCVMGCGGKGQVDVPINLKDAGNVGSLHVELVYDTAVLQAVEVKSGELAEKATIQSNLENPGRVVIGIINANGISGDGAAVTVSFDIIGEGTSALTLKNVGAHDATTLYDIVTTTSPGNFAGKNSLISPSITFQGGQQ